MWIILKDCARQLNPANIVEIVKVEDDRGDVRTFGIDVRGGEDGDVLHIETKDKTNMDRAYAVFANALVQNLSCVDLTSIK